LFSPVRFPQAVGRGVFCGRSAISEGASLTFYFFSLFFPVVSTAGPNVPQGKAPYHVALLYVAPTAFGSPKRPLFFCHVFLSPLPRHRVLGRIFPTMTRGSPPLTLPRGRALFLHLPRELGTQYSAVPPLSSYRFTFSGSLSVVPHCYSNPCPVLTFRSGGFLTVRSPSLGGALSLLLEKSFQSP